MNPKTSLLLLLLCIPIAFSQSSQFNMSLTLVNASCSDGVMNANETGPDCGGGCPPCASCFDGLLNQNETGNDCGGPCQACRTSRGKKGENQAIANPAERQDQEPEEYCISRLFPVVDTDQPASLKVNDTILLADIVSVRVKTTVNNMTLKICWIDDRDQLPENNISANQYFKISATELNSSNIENVEITFRIGKDEIDKAGSSAEVSLLTYKERWIYLEDAWVFLKTNYISKDSEYYYFSSKTDSVGLFAIALREVILQKAPDAPPASETEKTVEQPAVFQEIVNRRQTKIAAILFVLAVGLAVSLILDFRARRPVR